MPLDDTQIYGHSVVTNGLRDRGATDGMVAIGITFAYAESGFRVDARNSSGSSAYGLFQYLEGTWSFYFSNLDRYNPEHQLDAWVSDYNRYLERFYEGKRNGQIPQGLTFAEYFYIKHHEGNNSTDWNSPGSSIIGRKSTNSTRRTARCMGTFRLRDRWVPAAAPPVRKSPTPPTEAASSTYPLRRDARPM